MYNEGAVTVNQSITFPKRIFKLAGYYGLILQVPQYFMESQFSDDFPPAITHPELYYGFLGVTIAWAVAFLVIARDPIRFRPMMIPSLLEKVLFPPTVVVLFLLDRVPAFLLLFAFLDLMFAVLFWMAFRKTPARL
jgi:hypothetical protein